MDLLNSVFIFLSFVAVLALCFYFYKLAQHDKEETLKKAFQQEVEEQEAEEWLHTSFVPQILAFIQRKPKIIIKYTFVILMITVFLWMYTTNGLYEAARTSFFTAVVYVFAILYLYIEPHVFTLLKDLLPRKMRHSVDNDWMRGYIFFLPPACIIYFFLPTPSSFAFYLLVYTALFLCLLAATRISEDIEKEEEKHRRKAIKKLLEEETHH